MFQLQVHEKVTLYRMFIPLVEGFAGGNADATGDDVLDAFKAWVDIRGNAKRPFFSGVSTGGSHIDSTAHSRSDVRAVFGWHEDNGDFTSIVECNAIIEFSTHPELHRGLGDEDFLEMLESLTTFMGMRFKQARVYVMNYTTSELMIFQQEGTRTPTQCD